MLGIIWRIGEIVKNKENIQVFNDFSRFGGSKLASFSYIFGVSVSRSFSDRLGVGFGVDFGAVWDPKWGLWRQSAAVPRRFLWATPTAAGP